MNDGTEYAEMLKTMASSCDLVVRPAKRTRKKRDVKEDLVAKINARDDSAEVSSAETAFDAAGNATTDAETIIERPGRRLFARKKRDYAAGNATTDAETIIERPGRRLFARKKRDYAAEETGGDKKKSKFDIVYAEGIAAFVLVVAILLTNIFWENSGINTLFKKAFTPAQTVTDARSYSSFNAQSPSSSLASSVTDGVMTFSGKGALYPVCDGKVTSVEQSDDGKYTITVSHSGIFKTIIRGADFAYCDAGEDVFRYIPVCYVNGGEATVTMYDEDVVVTNFVLENGSIIWSV